MVFLKGSKQKREELQKTKPDLYSYFETVVEVRKRHEILHLPQQYLFLLVCCFERCCPHPLCQEGKGSNTCMEWFPNGPKVDSIPLPVPDPDQPWGSSNCNKCRGCCTGHFLSPKEAIKAIATKTHAPMSQPPSILLKEFFQQYGSDPSDALLENIAKKCLLPVNEVRMWLQHLQTVNTNRKRGAAKAAETRRRKKQGSSLPVTSAEQDEESEECCGVCGAVFGNTDEVEFWIACDHCDKWFHGDCVNINKENEPDSFYCFSCVSSV